MSAGVKTLVMKVVKVVAELVVTAAVFQLATMGVVAINVKVLAVQLVTNNVNKGAQFFVITFVMFNVVTLVTLIVHTIVEKFVN